MHVSFNRSKHLVTPSVWVESPGFAWLPNWPPAGTQWAAEEGQGKRTAGAAGYQTATKEKREAWGLVFELALL